MARQIRGARALAAGNLSAQASALIRYVVLARLLGPEQLGIAATMILISQFFDVVSDAGLDKYIIQSDRGNTKSVAGSIHGLMLVRGATLSTLLLISAAIAYFWHGNVDMAIGLLVLILSPIGSALVHFDFRRVQRHRNFALEGKIAMHAEAIALLITVVAAFALQNAVAASCGLAARSLATALMSHLYARRRYYVRIDRQHLGAIAAFGLPLMAHGTLQFLGGQGDRILIVNLVTLEALGKYSALILLIYYPATMLARFMQSLMLPMVVSARVSPERLKAKIGEFTLLILLIAIAIQLGFTLVAPTVLEVAYGREFVQPLVLIVAVATLQSSRFIRLLPTLIALGTGHSKSLMWGSLSRLLAFPLAILIESWGFGLIGIVAAFVIAEWIAIGVAFVTLRRYQKIAIAPPLWRFALFIAMSVAIFLGVLELVGERQAWSFAGFAVTGLGLAALLVIDRRKLIVLWRLVSDLLRALSPGGKRDARGT